MTVARPLSILHVDPERGLGGGERQVLGLLGHLHTQGLHQTLAADASGRLAPLVARLGIAVAPLRIRNHLDVVAGRRLAGLLAWFRRRRTANRESRSVPPLGGTTPSFRRDQVSSRE